MSARSARRSWASRLRWSRSGRPSAAPASTSAASPRRRCSTPRKSSRRSRTTFPRSASESASPKLDLKAMMKHKDDTVASNVNGVSFLFKKNKVETFVGHGTILAAGKVEVTSGDGMTQTLETKAICIATGSEVAKLPGVEIDEKIIVSSEGALELGAVPKKLVVVGGGIIGLELGSVWKRLGADVEVVEFLDRILPGMDAEVAKQFPAHPREAGHRLPSRHQGRRRREGEGRRQGHGRKPGRWWRAHDRGRCRAGRDRPKADDGRAWPRGRRHRARPRPRDDRRWVPNQHPRHLRDRRRRARADAGAQGGGRRGGLSRDSRRPARARKLRGHPRRSSTPRRKWPPSAKPRKS